MIEEWKDVPGYEDYYKVSNTGRVVRKLGRRCVKERELRAEIASGYKRVVLYVDTYKKMLVHRLVAMAFIPNPNGYPCINHKDEDKLNNNVCNLEWCTHKYNQNYGTICKRKSETEKKTKAALRQFWTNF